MIQERSHEAMLSSLGHDVDSVHELLEQVWRDSPEIGMPDRFSFETALVELVGNVFEHAGEGQGVFCVLTVEVRDGRLSAVLRDTGRADPVPVQEPGMPDPAAEGGRGLPLIRALVEDFTYERQGAVNRWRISRCVDAVAGAAGSVPAH